jgi:hypothetical protein
MVISGHQWNLHQIIQDQGPENMLFYPLLHNKLPGLIYKLIFLYVTDFGAIARIDEHVF